MKKHLPGHFHLWDPFSLLRTPSFFEEDDLAFFNEKTGLTLSEDEKNIYVEAALPGLDADDIEVSYDKGVLWIKGEKEKKEDSKKYYQKASSAFSYRINIPGDADETKEIDAEYKDGVMKITFAKKNQSMPKKINIKRSK